MRKHILSLMAASMAILASCSIDSYDTGDSEYSYLCSDMVDVQISNRQVQSMVTDSNIVLNIPTSLQMSEGYTTIDTLARMYIIYYKEKGKQIDIVSSANVVTLKPVDVKDALTQKKDPVYMEACWEAANHKYLNFSINLMSAATEGEKHLLSFTEDSITMAANGKSMHHVSLRHDQNSIPEYYHSNTFLSIPLTAYNSGDSLSVNIDTYSGTERKCIEIK